MGSRFREDSPKPQAGVAVLFAAPQPGSLQNTLDNKKPKPNNPKQVSSEAKILGLNRILTITEEGRRRSLRCGLEMLTNYESVRLSFKVRFTPLLSIVNAKVAAQHFAVMKILIASSYGLNPDEIGRSSQRTSIISTDSKFSMVWRNPQRMEALQDPQFHQLQTSDANIEGMDSFVQKILDQSPNEKESLLESEELAKIINSGDFQENSADGFGMSGSRLKSSCLSEELAYLSELAGHNRRSNRLEDLLNLKTSDSQRRLDRAVKTEPLVNTLTRIFHTKSNMHKRVGIARISSRSQELLQISRMVELLDQMVAYQDGQLGLECLASHSQLIAAREEHHIHFLAKISEVYTEALQRTQSQSLEEIRLAGRQRRLNELFTKYQPNSDVQEPDQQPSNPVGLGQTLLNIVKSLIQKKLLSSGFDVLKAFSSSQRVLEGTNKMESVLASRAARSGINRLFQHSKDFLKTITLSYKLFPRLTNISEDRCRFALQRLQEFHERVGNIEQTLGDLADDLEDKFVLEKRCAFNAIFAQQNDQELLNHTRILGMKLDKLTKKRLEAGLQHIADHAAFLILIEDICSKYHDQSRAAFFTELRICSKRVNTMVSHQQNFDSPDESPDEREDRFEYCKQLNMPRIQSEEEPLQTPLLKKNFLMESDGDIRSGIFEDRGNLEGHERKVSLAHSAKLQRSDGSIEASVRQIQLVSARTNARLRSGLILLQTIVQIGAFKRFSAGFEKLKQSTALQRQEVLLKLGQLLGRLLDRQKAAIFRKLKESGLRTGFLINETIPERRPEALTVLEGHVFSSVQSDCCELEVSDQGLRYLEESQPVDGEEEDMDPDQYIMAQILQAQPIQQDAELDLQIREAIQGLDDPTPEHIKSKASVQHKPLSQQQPTTAMKKQPRIIHFSNKHVKSDHQIKKSPKPQNSRSKLESVLSELAYEAQFTPLERRRLYPITPLGDSIAEEDWLRVKLPENNFDAFCLKRKFVTALISQNQRVNNSANDLTHQMIKLQNQYQGSEQGSEGLKREIKHPEKSLISKQSSANHNWEKINSGNLLERTNSTQKKFQSITKGAQETSTVHTAPPKSSLEELTNKKRHVLSKSSLSEAKLQSHRNAQDRCLITTKYSFDQEVSSISQVVSMQGRMNPLVEEEPIREFDSLAAEKVKSNNLHNLFLKSKLKASTQIKGQQRDDSSYNHEGNSTEKTTEKPSTGHQKTQKPYVATGSAKELEAIQTARNKTIQKQAPLRETKESLITLGDPKNLLRSPPGVGAASEGSAARHTTNSKRSFRESSSRNQGPSQASDERCTFGIAQAEQNSSRPTGGSSYRLVRGTNTALSDSEKQRGSGDLLHTIPQIGPKGLDQIHSRYGFASLGTETGRFGSANH